MENQKRVTLATIKAFVKKNVDRLYVRQLSSFDGMVDGVRPSNDRFRKVESVDLENSPSTLGIPGAWFVRGSRDYFSTFNKEGFFGYEVSNCCGSFILAVPSKEDPALIAEVVSMAYKLDPSVRVTGNGPFQEVN